MSVCVGCTSWTAKCWQVGSLQPPRAPAHGFGERIRPLFSVIVPFRTQSKACRLPTSSLPTSSQRSLTCLQVYDTPDSHVTRDWRVERAQLGDLHFNAMDTSGMELTMHHSSIQVHGGFCLSPVLIAQNITHTHTHTLMLQKLAFWILCLSAGASSCLDCPGPAQSPSGSAYCECKVGGGSTQTLFFALSLRVTCLR